MGRGWMAWNLLSKHRANMICHFTFPIFFCWHHNKATDFILLPVLMLQFFSFPLHVSSLKPNSRLLCDVLLCLTDSLFPSGCCQANVWSRLMLRAARCIFSLSSPIFKQQQPPLQPPGGMCANSYSPVGSIAITEPLLYPCNCIGSCFLSDQTVSQPPRETRFIILNKGCGFFFLVFFNRAWGFIF